MNCHACQERANGNQARYTKLYLNLVLLQVIVLISELILKEALDLVLRFLNYRYITFINHGLEENSSIAAERWTMCIKSKNSTNFHR